MKRGPVKIKRKLAEHNALVAEVKQAVLTYSDREKKESLHGFVTERVLKNYRAVNAVRREICISKTSLTEFIKKELSNF